MTLSIQPPQARDDANSFRVGNFDLFSRRNCVQAREHFGLSHREIELIMHVAGGATKNEIADLMGVTSATTDTFRRRAYVKLGVKSGTAAVAIICSFLAGTRVEERAPENAI